MAVESRQFVRADLGDLLALISANAKCRWPRMTHLHPGDVAWQFPGAAPKDNIRLWFRGNSLVGYAWFQPPEAIRFDVDQHDDDAHAIREEMLRWAASRRWEFDPNFPFYIELKSMQEWAERILHPRVDSAHQTRYLVTSAFDSDADEIAFLAENDFRPTEHFEPFLTRSLDVIPDLPAPAGVCVRHVEATDLAQRVEVHKAAWWPSTGFTLERYLQVRGFTAAFDPELDLVAEAVDGSFACCCIGWTDTESKIAFIEPFGTHPDWRGKGVSSAVIYEFFRRARAKGMHHVRIYTAGFNHQAIRLYESCGLKLIDRSRTYLKAL